LEQVNELALSYWIAIGHPANPHFADCVHGFISLDHPPIAFRGPESEACSDALLYEPVG
jgi:hypothetical protein